MLKAFSVCLSPGGLGLGKQEWAHTPVCTSAFQYRLPAFQYRQLTHGKDPWSMQSRHLGLAFESGFILPQETFRVNVDSSWKLPRTDLGAEGIHQGAEGLEYRGQGEMDCG